MTELERELLDRLVETERKLALAERELEAHRRRKSADRVRKGRKSEEISGEPQTSEEIRGIPRNSDAPLSSPDSPRPPYNPSSPRNTGTNTHQPPDANPTDDVNPRQLLASQLDAAGQRELDAFLARLRDPNRVRSWVHRLLDALGEGGWTAEEVGLSLGDMNANGQDNAQLFRGYLRSHRENSGPRAASDAQSDDRRPARRGHRGDSADALQRATARFAEIRAAIRTERVDDGHGGNYDAKRLPASFTLTHAEQVAIAALGGIATIAALKPDDVSFRATTFAKMVAGAAPESSSETAAPPSAESSAA